MLMHVWVHARVTRVRVYRYGIRCVGKQYIMCLARVRGWMQEIPVRGRRRLGDAWVPVHGYYIQVM